MGGWTRLWIALSCVWIGYTYFTSSFTTTSPVALASDLTGERPAMPPASAATELGYEQPKGSTFSEQWQPVKDQIAVAQRKCFTVVKGPDPIELIIIGHKLSDIKCAVANERLIDFAYKATLGPLILLIAGFALNWVLYGFKDRHQS